MYQPILHDHAMLSVNSRSVLWVDYPSHRQARCSNNFHRAKCDLTVAIYGMQAAGKIFYQAALCLL